MNKVSKIFLLIFLTGLALCLASSLDTTITWTPLEYHFGLLCSLPLLFWVGFTFLILATLLPIKADNEPLGIFKLVTVYGLFQGIPSLFLSNPYRGDTYGIIRITSEVGIHGFIPISQTTEAYLQFPGQVLFIDSVHEVTGVSLLGMAQYFPIVSSTVTLLCAYIFFRRFVQDKVRLKLLTFITMFGLVYMQYHMVPQAFALIPLLVLATALTHRGSRWVVIAVLAMGFLTISHPPTAVFALLFTGMAAICELAFRKVPDRERQLGPELSPSIKGRSLRFSLVFILCLILWLGWVMMPARGFTTQVTAGFINFAQTELVAEPTGFVPQVPRVIQPLFTQLSWQLSQSSPYHLTTRIRTIAFFIITLCCLLSLWPIFRRARTRVNLLLFAWLAAVVAITILYVLYFRLNLADRAYMLLLLIAPLIVFTALPHLPNVKWQSCVIALFLIASLAEGSTTYRDSNQYIVPTQSLVLTAFLDHHKGEGTMMVIDPYSHLWRQLQAAKPAAKSDDSVRRARPKIYDNGIHELYLLK